VAATKLQANWSNVTHGSNPITRVTQVSFNIGGALQSFSADGDHYPTVIVNLMNKPTASVATSDAGNVMNNALFAPGTVAVLSATHKDAKGSSGGDILYVLANATVETATASGAHGQFGTATLSFQAFSSDGSTPPLSFTRA
jgi:hypothetical protein